MARRRPQGGNSVIRVARRLLAIGVICGMIHYVQDDGTGGIRRFVIALVEELPDVTYRQVPPTVDFCECLTADLLG